MDDSVSYNFLRLQFPDLSLARAFNLPSKGIVYDAVRLVFDYHQDRHYMNGRSNLAAAYNDSADYIDGSLAIFARYQNDYDLGYTEYNTALAAWLCQNCVDPTDPDYWDAIGPDAMSILAYLEHDHTVFPKLSDAASDHALAINIGLQIWHSLDFRLTNYKSPGVWHSSFFNDPEADRRYALTIMQDKPAHDTALADACQIKAKELVDALRGRIPGRHIHPV